MAAGWSTALNPVAPRVCRYAKGATWHMGWGTEPFTVSLVAEVSQAEVFRLHPIELDQSRRFFHGVICGPELGQNGERLGNVSLVDEGGKPREDNSDHARRVQLLGQRIIYLTTERHVTKEHASSGTLGPITLYDGSQIKRWLNDLLTPRTQQDRLIKDQFLADVRSIDSFRRCDVPRSSWTQMLRSPCVFQMGRTDIPPRLRIAVPDYRWWRSSWRRSTCYPVQSSWSTTSRTTSTRLAQEQFCNILSQRGV